MSRITQEMIDSYVSVNAIAGNYMSQDQAVKEMTEAEQKQNQKKENNMSTDTDMTDELFSTGSKNEVTEVTTEAVAEEKSKSKNTQDLDITPPAPAKIGRFFRRTKDVHYIRFYLFEHDGSKKLAVKKATHWIDGKCFPCDGKGCKMCVDKGPSLRYTCNIVDRANKPNVIQIWDVPSTVYQWVYNYAKDLTNPASCFGNNGKTFKISYDESVKRYNVTPYEKDNAVLSIDTSYDLLESK